ncbi:MAG: ABC transporter permease subunit [Acetobacteraceae bacterium]|nr:ABC transporter permease subunit [Acetobacteraceae bacterium]
MRFIPPLVTALVTAFLIGPILLSALAGVTANWFLGLSGGFTLQWIGRVWEHYAHTIGLSVWLAFATLICTLVLGVPAAWSLARSESRAARLLEEALVLPVAVPGIATALGLIMLWGAVGDFRTHWSFVLVGHVLFTLPFMLRSTIAAMKQADLPVLEEAAAACGARFWRRFRTVVLPAARGGILAGSLMVVALSLGEFNMSLLLTSPFTMTLPVGLADSYASLRLEIGSAFTLVFLVLLVPPLIALQMVADRLGGVR